MGLKNLPIPFSLMLFLGLGSVLVSLSLLSSRVSAALPDRPTPRYTATATTEPPPTQPPITPEATVTLPPTSSPVSESGALTGAYIQLDISGLPAGAWTVVQWQTQGGEWYDVEGWRGYINGQPLIWWVAPKDFETGPFRWAIYDQVDGNLIGTSPSFILPRGGEYLLLIPSL